MTSHIQKDIMMRSASNINTETSKQPHFSKHQHGIEEHMFLTPHRARKW